MISELYLPLDHHPNQTTCLDLKPCFAYNHQAFSEHIQSPLTATWHYRYSCLYMVESNLLLTHFFMKLLQSLEQGTWSREIHLPFVAVKDISSPTSSWRRTISQTAFRAHAFTFSLPRLMFSPASTIFERRGYQKVFIRASWLFFTAASAWILSRGAASFCCMAQLPFFWL